MVPSRAEQDFASVSHVSDDPDLTHLNAAWETIPIPIKTAILALLDAANPTHQRGTTNV
jgi:hypothetical protein